MSMLDEALKYAKRRVPIFPCAPYAKTPLTPNGFRNASCSQEQVRKWWTKWPDANIGMPTGFLGHDFQTADILDVDIRPGGSGYELYKELRQARRLDGAFALVKTPSGGIHLYFHPSENPSGSLRGQFIDYKAVGGYVLLPPSKVITEHYAGTYELMWSTPKFLETYTLEHRLNWQAIKDDYDPPVYAYVDGEFKEVNYTADWLGIWLKGQKEGNRNNALHWAAHRAMESGITDFTLLIEAALDIGLEEAEIKTTLKSALRDSGRSRSERGTAGIRLTDGREVN